MKNYTNGEMERWIDDHIHSKRNRIILKLHYIDGLSADEIAKHKEVVATNHGAELSPRWTYHIIDRAGKEFDRQ